MAPRSRSTSFERGRPARGDEPDDISPLCDAPEYLGVGRAVEDLSSFSTFTEILNRQMRSVTDLSEAAAGSILSNLTGVDAKITALLQFIQQSGSSDQVERVVTQIESQMKGCRELLDRFATRQLEYSRLGLAQRSRGRCGHQRRARSVGRRERDRSANHDAVAERVESKLRAQGRPARGFRSSRRKSGNSPSVVQALSTEVHARVQALMRTVTVDLQEQTNQRERAEHEADRQHHRDVERPDGQSHDHNHSPARHSAEG